MTFLATFYDLLSSGKQPRTTPGFSAVDTIGKHQHHSSSRGSFKDWRAIGERLETGRGERKSSKGMAFHNTYTLSKT